MSVRGEVQRSVQGARTMSYPFRMFDVVPVRSVSLLLQPTVGQVARLGRLLDAQRELYNAALEERRGVWRWEHRPVSRYEQHGHLTGWDHPVLEFGIVPARGTLVRLDRAFTAFYRRCRVGQTPGFPRFKGAARFDSVEYPDRGCWKIGANRLYVKGVGHIRFRTSRRGIRGVPKTMTIRREGHRWRATIFCAVPAPEPRPGTGRVVGIDLGVTELVATSDRELVANPRWSKRTASRLADTQRQIARRQPGSNRRRRAVGAVGRLQRKARLQRRDHHHQLSRRLVDRYDLIVHEDLKITNLMRRPAPRRDGEGGFSPNGAAAKTGLNRGIADAGWASLLAMLRYKAEDAGVELLAVNPHHTSQTCAACGHIDARNRVGIAFRCTGCGHTDHADLNAATNIVRAGLAQRPTSAKSTE